MSWVEVEMSWVEVEMSWVEVDGARWSWVEVGARLVIPIYKLSSDNKTLSSLIKKAWCTCTFLNHFREANEQLLCALFL